MKLRMKELIVNYVRLENGLSSLKLSLYIMGTIGPSLVVKSEYDAAIEELLRDKEIIKVEFTDAESPSAKTIYFLKGTTFKNLTFVSPETPVETSAGKNQLANESH